MDSAALIEASTGSRLEDMDHGPIVFNDHIAPPISTKLLSLYIFDPRPPSPDPVGWPDTAALSNPLGFQCMSSVSVVRRRLGVVVFVPISWRTRLDIPN